MAVFIANPCGRRSAVSAWVLIDKARFPSGQQEVVMSKLITVVVLLTAAAFATAARAAPQNNPAPQQADTASNTASDHNATSNHASPIKPGDRGCLRDTGSLIPPKKGQCLPVTGRSYTQKDIQATGETNLGPALQQLDPAITVHGNGY
jgi:hypothetical protein